MSETPRTEKELQIQAEDAFYSNAALDSTNAVCANFARQLERELTAMTAERDELLKIIEDCGQVFWAFSKAAEKAGVADMATPPIAVAKAILAKMDADGKEIAKIKRQLAEAVRQVDVVAWTGDAKEGLDAIEAAGKAEQ